MNKFWISLAAFVTVAGVVFAQELGRPQVPGSPEVRPGLGQVMRGGSASVAASEKYVYVLRGDTLYQYLAEGMRPTGQTRLQPSVDGPGGGRRNRDNNLPTQ
jgi:hypothetical protein